MLLSGDRSFDFFIDEFRLGKCAIVNLELVYSAEIFSLGISIKLK